MFPKVRLTARRVLPEGDMVKTLVSFTSARKAAQSLKPLFIVCSSMTVSEKMSSLADVPETCRQTDIQTEKISPGQSSQACLAHPVLSQSHKSQQPHTAGKYTESVQCLPDLNIY